MNFVAGGAGDLILGVAAFEAADVRRLIQMAGETDLVGCRGGELRRIADVGGRGRFGMLLRRPVAGLAGPPLPAALRVGLDRMMGLLAKAFVDILVTDLAGFRAGVRRRRRRRGSG